MERKDAMIVNGDEETKEINIQKMNFSIGVKMYTLMVTSSW